MDLLSGTTSAVQLDPRQGLLYNQPHMIIKKSASSIVNQFYSPDSKSLSNVTWSTIQPPSKSTLIDRRWFMRLSVDINFVGDAGTTGLVDNYLLPVDNRYPSALGIGVFDSSIIGLRALPLNSCIGNTQMSINGVSVTNNTSQFSNILPYTFTPDQTNVYNMCTNPDTWQTIAQYAYNNNNPIANYGQSYSQSTRGDAVYTIMSNSKTTGTLRISWYEPLIVPALLHLNGPSNNSALVGISNVNLVLSLQNLANLIEIPNWGSTYPIQNALPNGWVIYPTISTIDFRTCDLMLTFITPTIALPPIPLPVKYNYENFYTLTKDYGSNPVAAGTSMLPPITSNNIQLAVLPSKILIYVGKSQNKGVLSVGNTALPNYNFTDTMASIENISINFNNQSGLLNSSDKYQLYQMSQANGVTQSYAQWSNYQGSLIVINLARDLPSDVLAAVGSNQTNNFVVQVTFSDTNPTQIFVNPAGGNSTAYDNLNKVNYTLYTVFVYDEVFTIGEIAASVTQSYDSIHILKDLQEGRLDSSILDYEMYSNPQALGMGSFWSDMGRSLRRGISSIGSWLKNHPSFGKDVVGAIGTAATALAPEFAPLIGVGVKGINSLIDHYLGKGYTPDEIMGILSSQYPKSMIESALVQASGGRQVCKSRLVKRRY